MSKFKVEHGASKVNLVLLKTNIEDTISQDIDLMSTWSNNDRKYIVNELLRFRAHPRRGLPEVQGQRHRERFTTRHQREAIVSQV